MAHTGITLKRSEINLAQKAVSIRLKGDGNYELGINYKTTDDSPVLLRGELTLEGLVILRQKLEQVIRTASNGRALTVVNE